METASLGIVLAKIKANALKHLLGEVEEF